MSELERVLAAWGRRIEPVVHEARMVYVALPTPREEAERLWALRQALEVARASERLLEVLDAIGQRDARAVAAELHITRDRLKALLAAKPP